MTNQLIISNTSIKQDTAGRYSLNDLHKASGNKEKDKPANWLRSEKTIELIDEILIAQNREVKNPAQRQPPVMSKSGRYGGTYVCKELVYSYAMWISAAFSLKVIRAYDALVSSMLPRKSNFRQATAKQLTPLRQTAERLIAHGVGNIYPDIWKHVHAEFGVQHINELLPEQIPLAISYLDALEGEYIPKQEALPVPKLDINYPLTWYPDNHPFMKNCYCRDGKMQLNRKVLVETQSPVKGILTKLAQQGYDVSSAVFEIDTLRHIVSETHWALHEIEKIAAVRDNANLTINI